MIRLLIRTGALGALLLAASGCAMMADVAATSVVTAVVDRTVSDYEGSECRLAELIRTGTMCKVAEAPPAPPPPVYCFKTLGRTDCYSHPDPYDLEESPRTRASIPLKDPPVAPAPIIPVAAAAESGRQGSGPSEAPKPDGGPDVQLRPAAYTTSRPST